MARRKTPSIIGAISGFMTLWAFGALLVSLAVGGTVGALLEILDDLPWWADTLIGLAVAALLLVIIWLAKLVFGSDEGSDDAGLQPGVDVIGDENAEAAAMGERSRASSSHEGSAVVGDVHGDAVGRDKTSAGRDVVASRRTIEVRGDYYEASSDASGTQSPARDVPAPEVKLGWEGRPLPIGEGLVGRENDLARMEEGLKRNRALILTGGPGTGKSRLVVEYTFLAGAEGLWIDAGESIIHSLAFLAGRFNVAQEGRSDEEITVDVDGLLETLPGDALLVFDNVPDMKTAGELINRVAGQKLVITTRDAQIRDLGLKPPVAGTMALEALVTDAGVKLLAERSGLDPSVPGLADLVEAVGGLPMAIESLAYKFEDGLERPASVVEQLRGADVLILDEFQDAVGFSIPRVDGVFNALTGNIRSLPEDVQAQLAPLGYLADAPASFALVEALTGLDEGPRNEMLRRCSSRSILTWEAGNVSVHNLTSAAIRMALCDSETLRAATERVEFRIGTTNFHDVPALREELIHYEHVHSMSTAELPEDDDYRMRLDNHMVVCYSILGQNIRALELNEKTLEVRERLLGNEHPDTITSRGNLANRYGEAGDHPRAAGLLEEMLETMEQMPPPGHPNLVTAWNNLAIAYGNMGRHDDAISLHEKALEFGIRKHGPENPDTLRYRNNLANSYRLKGCYEKAITLGQDIVKVCERELDFEHPITLAVRTSLAISYLSVGRHDEGIELLENALEARERVFGLEHSLTLGSRRNLATAYRAAEREADAERLEEGWRFWHDED